MQKKIEEIGKKLQNLTPYNISNEEQGDFKRSAVLLLFHEQDDGLFLIMTSRAQNLRHHNGEMSFPGGKFDKEFDSSLEETSIRETYEEIGIPMDDIQVLGRLDDFPTVTGYIIRPFVGFTENTDFKLNPDEVAEIVRIPISFLETENLLQETIHENSGKKFSILSFDFNQNDDIFTIWGASAHLITELMQYVFDHRMTSETYSRPTIKELTQYRLYVKNIKEKIKPN